MSESISSINHAGICHSLIVATAALVGTLTCESAKTPDDLHRHKTIELKFASGQTVPWEFKNRAGKASTFETKSPALVVSDTEAVGDAAVLGLGISRVSLHFAWPHLVAGRLKIVLNDFNEPGKREWCSSIRIARTWHRE